MKAGQQAATAWNTGQKAWSTARSWIKGWTDGTDANIDTKNDESSGTHAVVEKDPAPDAPPVPADEEHAVVPNEDEQEEAETPRKPLWGPTKCCISCVSPLPLVPMLSVELTGSARHRVL